MEVSYATELQWVGKGKREALYYVRLYIVLKCQRLGVRAEGKVHLPKYSKFAKHG